MDFLALRDISLTATHPIVWPGACRNGSRDPFCRRAGIGMAHGCNSRAGAGSYKPHLTRCPFYLAGSIPQHIKRRGCAGGVTVAYVCRLLRSPTLRRTSSRRSWTGVGTSVSIATQRRRPLVQRHRYTTLRRGQTTFPPRTLRASACAISIPNTSPFSPTQLWKVLRPENCAASGGPGRRICRGTRPRDAPGGRRGGSEFIAQIEHPAHGEPQAKSRRWARQSIPPRTGQKRLSFSPAVPPIPKSSVRVPQIFWASAVTKAPYLLLRWQGRHNLRASQPVSASGSLPVSTNVASPSSAAAETSDAVAAPPA